MQSEQSQSNTHNRGFASMDAEKQREIARKGGKAAHAKGTAHEFNADEARAAGRKGGERVSSNREHMSRIGRIGGKSSAQKRQSPDRQQATGHPGDGSGHRAEDFRDSGMAHAGSHAEPRMEDQNAGGEMNRDMGDAAEGSASGSDARSAPAIPSPS